MNMNTNVLVKNIATGVIGGITSSVVGAYVGAHFNKKIAEAYAEGDEVKAKAWYFGKIVTVGAVNGALSGVTTTIQEEAAVVNTAAILPEVEPIVLHF